MNNFIAKFYTNVFIAWFVPRAYCAYYALSAFKKSLLANSHVDPNSSSVVMILVKETTSVSEWMILVSPAKWINYMIFEDATVSLIC